MKTTPKAPEAKKEKTAPAPAEAVTVSALSEADKKVVSTAQVTISEDPDLDSAWGAEEASSEDIIIPKILLMHGQSKKVIAGDNTIGQLVKSTSGEILAERNARLEVIPFMMTKTWRISEMVSPGPGKAAQAKWAGEEAWTLANTELPWEYEQDGKQMRRDKSYNFYVLLPGDLKDGKQAFPLRLQFTRTSRKAGAAIADYFAQSKAVKRAPATVVWEIGNETITGKDNTYLVFTAKQKRATERPELIACKFWWDTVSKNKDKIRNDEGEDTSEGSATDVHSESADY